VRIGYLIGALGAGGAERQVAELAGRLAERGHVVEVLAYDGTGVFDNLVTRRGGTLRHLDGGSKARKVRLVRRWLQSFQPAVLHGVMKRASSLAILATLPTRRIPVVATDMSTATYARYKPSLWASLVLFHMASRVVTQTETNRRSLLRLAPLLGRRVTVVRNGVDVTRFSPDPPQSHSRDVFRFVCVGKVSRVKNPVRVVEAARVLRERGLGPFCVDWIGRFTTGRRGGLMESYQQAKERVRRYGLENVVRFLGETMEIEKEYRSGDAILHASVQEGIPNAVIEAMACGLPVVVSRVSDLPAIVEQARNGFLCDSHDPRSIANAMEKMLETKVEDRLAMGERSRELAVTWFGMDRFVTDFEALYLDLIGAAR